MQLFVHVQVLLEWAQWKHVCASQISTAVQAHWQLMQLMSCRRHPKRKASDEGMLISLKTYFTACYRVSLHVSAMGGTKTRGNDDTWGKRGYNLRELGSIHYQGLFFLSFVRLQKAHPEPQKTWTSPRGQVVFTMTNNMGEFQHKQLSL